MKVFLSGVRCCSQTPETRKSFRPRFYLPGLITNAGAALKSWVCGFVSSCLRRLKIPKVWRRALVVAIPKPKKSLEDSKSYHSISLLCVPYKILERLIHSRVEPIVGPLLRRKWAGFLRERSTVEQGQQWNKVKILRIRLRPKRRLVPCLSI